MWIRIFSKGVNISSHLPYSLCDDNLIEYWFENEWITRDEYFEIKKQKSKDNQEHLKFEEIERLQLNDFVRKL